MKKALVFFGLLALVGVFALAVQDPADTEVAEFLGLDEALIGGIMSAFGLGILGIVQLIKGWTKKFTETWTPLARHAFYKFVALLCSAGVTYWVLTRADMFSLWPNFALYGIWTFGVATGIWRSLKANSG